MATYNKNSDKHKDEIVMFTKELKHYDLTYLAIATKQPKKKDDLSRAIAIATYISEEPDSILYLEKNRNLPIKFILKNFDIAKRFIKKNESYIIAISLLLKGPYSELKKYLFGGDALNENRYCSGNL